MNRREEWDEQARGVGGVEEVGGRSSSVFAYDKYSHDDYRIHVQVTVLCSE